MKKMVLLTTMLRLLAFLLCGTALACPNPNEQCYSVSYMVEYADNKYHIQHANTSIMPSVRMDRHLHTAREMHRM